MKLLSLLPQSPTKTKQHLQKENDRLDIVHKMTTVMLHDRLHLSPIAKDPQRILDLGTGTGIWAMDMGKSVPAI